MSLVGESCDRFAMILAGVCRGDAAFEVETAADALNVPAMSTRCGLGAS